MIGNQASVGQRPDPVLLVALGLARVIAEDPEDGEGPEVATYCPLCADLELRPVDHAVGYD